MQNKIHKICVIGSGVMGSSIAALIANSGQQVVLLDIVSNDPNDRNAISKIALENMQKQSPPPLSHPSKTKFITIGNLEDDLFLITECDWVIEVIVEKLEIKHQLYNKIIPYLKENSIIASNTSTLPLKKLKENLADSIRSRFLITHFFNPPRYMELVELVIDRDLNPNIIEEISNFLTDLGKTIVKCNDTPGFIANRAGCFLLELVVRKAIRLNLSPVIIDKIFTNLFKLPSTGIFGLYDLIGHDVMKLISTSLINNLPDSDNYRKIYLDTPILDKMIEHKLIGRKGDGGFYRMSLIDGRKIKEIINFNDLSYQPIENTEEEFLSIQELLSSNSIYGRFFCEIVTEFYLYLASLIPSVTDNIYDIDLAMKLGYSWKIGPFELLAYHIDRGFEFVIEQAKLMKLPLPDYLANHSYNKIDKEKFQLGHNILQESKILLENNSATLALYHNCLIFTIHTKMNCLNKDVFSLLLESVDVAEDREQNLYIYPQNMHFSVGADLAFFISCIENKDFNALEEFLKLGQKTMMRLKYSSINIISCALGVALGGGCEILLNSDFIVANQELNAGLVEVGLGLIPGWSGVKEMFYRANGDKNWLVKNLQNIIRQNKSSSADYFIIDYGMTNVQVNMNKHSILDEALQLNLAQKIVKQRGAITLPDVILTKELEITTYNDLQMTLLSKFQNIITKQQISEDDLLEFERQTFIELAKNPLTLDKLKKVVK